MVRCRILLAGKEGYLNIQSLSLIYIFITMIKTTQKTQSLLDIWNSDTGVEDTDGSIQFPERIKLQKQLQDLILDRIEYYRGDELFEEYHSNFKWDASYTLTVHWEVEYPEDPDERMYKGIYETFEFPLEELKVYLDGVKEPPDRTSDMTEEDEAGEGVFTGLCSIYGGVVVNNLRPRWWDNLPTP